MGCYLGPELLLMAESGPVFCCGRSRLLPRMCVNYLTCSGCCSHHNSCCRHSLLETRCKGIGFTVGHSPGLRAPLPWQIKIQRGNIGAVPVDSRTQLYPAVGMQMDIASTGRRGCGRVTWYVCDFSVIFKYRRI